jgi:rifampicin phosphotransferase
VNRGNEPDAGLYVVPLRDITREDAGRVGAKAANLGAMACAGFPVPDGFALTTQAFDRFVKENALDGTQPAQEVGKAPVPREVLDALRTVSYKLDGARLAVRSSGVAEDLEGASFAGQYETVLGVSGYEALVDAVRQCWASAFSARVSAYKDGKKQAAGGMAVLVQQLVPADAAGVAFTANPVNGRRDETVVSAVRGLGERLVSGSASPDEWTVQGSKAIRTSAPEEAIDENQARAIANMARQAEAFFGAAQDVEWAIAEGKLYMLQARPITTLQEPALEPIPMNVEIPEGYWESDAEHMPKPLSPMGRSVILSAFTNGTAKMSATLGLLIDGFEYRDIGGWAYLRLVPPGGKDRTPPPAWLTKILLRLSPDMRVRIRRATEFVRNLEQDALVERWYNEWYPEISKQIVALRDVELPKLPDDALEAHLSDTLALIERGSEVHFALAAVNPIVIYDLVTTSQDLLGWDEAQTLRLVTGLSTKSTEPSRRLAELAQMARGRPAVYRIIEQQGADAVDQLRQTDAEFAAAFARYLQEYGCRGLAFDLNEPAVSESPALVLSWIRNQIANNYDPDADAAALEASRQAAQAEARVALAQRSAQERERFERTLASAVRGYPTQEDNVFFTQGAPTALARFALLELGDRLVKRQVIATRDDVFFLEIDEARKAFRHGGDLKALVLYRKGERLWAESHPGPAAYGKKPAQPPLDVLPPEPRYLMSVLGWYLERAIATGRGHVQEEGVRLNGIAASPGKYQGTVRVIMNEREFHKLQPGDVVACPATTPVWSVLFSNIGALVTNTGGILSHPAIIAREYRIPAVVATGNATSLLKDGQVVTVDGSSGMVELAA